MPEVNYKVQFAQKYFNIELCQFDVLNEVDVLLLDRKGMVTHDSKIAARCSRILYIVDGQIAGEYKNNNNTLDQKEKERALNTWLMDMGW